MCKEGEGERKRVGKRGVKEREKGTGEERRERGMERESEIGRKREGGR